MNENNTDQSEQSNRREDPGTEQEQSEESAALIIIADDVRIRPLEELPLAQYEAASVPNELPMEAQREERPPEENSQIQEQPAAGRPEILDQFAAMTLGLPRGSRMPPPLPYDRTPLPPPSEEERARMKRQVVDQMQCHQHLGPLESSLVQWQVASSEEWSRRNGALMGFVNKCTYVGDGLFVSRQERPCFKCGQRIKVRSHSCRETLRARIDAIEIRMDTTRDHHKDIRNLKQHAYEVGLQLSRVPRNVGTDLLGHTA